MAIVRGVGVTFQAFAGDSAPAAGTVAADCALTQNGKPERSTSRVSGFTGSG